MLRTLAGLAIAAVALGCAANDVDDGEGGGGTSSAGSSGADDAPSESTGAPTTTTASTSDGGSGGSVGPDGSGSEDGPPPATCPETSLSPGSHLDLEIEHDGRTRFYDVLVPDSYDPGTPTPIVFNFHGFTSNPQQQAWFSVIEPVAQAHGTIVVHPAGIEYSWNGGLCCGEAADTDVDDVGFARALVQHIATQVCIDPARVYSMGMSNGGYLSHRIACEAADVFTAIGPVAGVIGIPMQSCAPSRPISVMHFHGTEDSLVPYEGGGVMGIPGVRETMTGWAARNGCASESEITLQMDDVTCETWPGCDAGVEVTLCTIDGAGHCWPGNSLCPFGSSTTTVNASEMLATFFEQFTLP